MRRRLRAAVQEVAALARAWARGRRATFLAKAATSSGARSAALARAWTRSRRATFLAKAATNGARSSRARQSVGEKFCILFAERIHDAVHLRQFAFNEQNLYDVISPGHLPANAQATEPVPSTAFDELLFLSIHRFGGTMHWIAIGACFDLDETDDVALAADDVHLASMAGAMVGFEDGAALFLQPERGDTLTDAANLCGGPAFAFMRRNERSAERLGRTNGDGSRKVREEPALQGAGQSGNLCEHRIHNGGSARPVAASVGHA